MSQSSSPICPHCGQSLTVVSDDGQPRCQSCAVLVDLNARSSGAQPARSSGYVTAVIISTVICLGLILTLIAVTGFNLLRG